MSSYKQLLCSFVLASVAFSAYPFGVPQNAYQHVGVKNENFARQDVSTSHYDNATPLSDKRVAHNYGLTAVEYKSYLYDISDTPDKYFYDIKNTNPLWVLASHVEGNKTLFDRYIKQSVKLAYQETMRMEKVGVAFSTEAHKLYPNQYPVMISHGVQRGDTVRIYCRLHSIQCSNNLSTLVKEIQKKPGVKLDVFLVDATTRSQIEQFASNNQLPISLVNSGAITLNFGQSSYEQEKAVTKSNHLELPLILAVRHGVQHPTHMQGGGL